MNTLGAIAWNGKSWIATVVLLFLAQVALICLFAERVHSVSSGKRAVGTAFRLCPNPMNEKQLASRFFASDPNVFSAARLHGVAQRGWTRLTQQSYQLPDAEEPIQVLNVNPASLCARLPFKENANRAFPFEHAAQPRVTTESLRFFPEPEASTQSVARVEGAAAERLLENPGSLPAWPHSDVLSNSVVQIGVDRAGEVISARLLARCGLEAADEKALELARRLQFKPIGPGYVPQLDWGKLVFEWKTVLPEQAGENVALKPK